MIEVILAAIGSLQVGGFALMWYRLGRLEQAVNNHQKANEVNSSALKRLQLICPLCILKPVDREKEEK